MKLEKGKDFIIDERSGLIVFTAHYLLERGFCCGNKCKNCPYVEKKDENPPNLDTLSGLMSN